MVNISYSASLTVADAFDFFFGDSPSSVLIGTLARDEFLSVGRYEFVRKIHALLELFGYKSDSDMHDQCKIKFFALLDEILRSSLTKN